jgi:hypothetical protein
MTDVPLYEEEDDVSWAHTLNLIVLIVNRGHTQLYCRIAIARGDPPLGHFPARGWTRI